MLYPKKRTIVPGSLDIAQVFELQEGDRIEFRSIRGYSVFGKFTRIDGERIFYDDERGGSYKDYHYLTDAGLIPYDVGSWNPVWSVHLIEKKPTPVVVKFFGRDITLLPVTNEKTTELSVKDCKHRHVYRDGKELFVCLVTASHPAGSNLPAFIFTDEGMGEIDNFYCPGSNPFLKNLTLIGKLPNN